MMLRRRSKLVKKLYRDWTEAHRVGFSFQLQSINSVQPHSPAVSEREKTIIINFGHCFVFSYSIFSESRDEIRCICADGRVSF